MSIMQTKLTHPSQRKISTPYFAISAIVLSSLASCDSSDYERPPIDHIGQCFYEGEWNAEKIRDSMIGRWQWTYTEGGGTWGHYIKDQEFILEFTSDSIVKAVRNDTLIQQSSWYIKPVDMTGQRYWLLPLFSLEIAYGFIYLCDDYLIFSDKGSDGPTTYFQKLH
jgi:hypothetical protein